MLSYASRWDFCTVIQAQRRFWSSASNSAGASRPVTALQKRRYPSSGVRAFVHPIAPTTTTAIITRANVPDMGRVISRISRIETPASAVRPGPPPTVRGFARAARRLIGVAVLVSAGSSTSMDDPAQTGPRPVFDLCVVDEFVDIP